eukprot:9972591-Alexandrium_andersonii.AAC.1
MPASMMLVRKQCSFLRSLLCVHDADADPNNARVGPNECTRHGSERSLVRKTIRGCACVNA